VKFLDGANLFCGVQNWWLEQQLSFIEAFRITAWFLGVVDLYLLCDSLCCGLSEDLIGSLQLELVGLHLLGDLRVVKLHQDPEWLSDLKRILEHSDFGRSFFLHEITDLVGDGLYNWIFKHWEQVAGLVEFPQALLSDVDSSLGAKQGVSGDLVGKELVVLRYHLCY